LPPQRGFLIDRFDPRDVPFEAVREPARSLSVAALAASSRDDISLFTSMPWRHAARTIGTKRESRPPLAPLQWAMGRRHGTDEFGGVARARSRVAAIGTQSSITCSRASRAVEHHVQQGALDGSEHSALADARASTASVPALDERRLTSHERKSTPVK
jgi:hypothetical protein